MKAKAKEEEKNLEINKNLQIEQLEESKIEKMRKLYKETDFLKEKKAYY